MIFCEAAVQTDQALRSWPFHHMCFCCFVEMQSQVKGVQQIKCPNMMQNLYYSLNDTSHERVNETERDVVACLKIKR